MKWSLRMADKKEFDAYIKAHPEWECHLPMSVECVSDIKKTMAYNMWVLRYHARIVLKAMIDSSTRNIDKMIMKYNETN